MVDLEGFFQSCSIYRPTIMPFYKEESHAALRSSHVSTDAPSLGSSHTVARLSENQRLTCPPLVPAYLFAAGSWCLVSMSDLTFIEWDATILEEVQIESKYKEAIKELAQGFLKNARLFDDFVKGKGRGLVCLLHGDPGCGKTMLAGSCLGFLNYVQTANF